MASETRAKDFEARCRARAAWPVKRRGLHDDDVDTLPAEVTHAERLAIAWRLSLEAWTLTGRALPRYDRAHIPGRVFRPGERPIDDD